MLALPRQGDKGWYRFPMVFRQARGKAKLGLPTHEGMRASAAWLSWGSGPALLVFLLTGCGGGYCEGPDCGCNGRDECIIDCQRDNCDIECSNAGSSCGAICGDGCDFECSQTDHCSSFSGNDSVIHCHNVPSCASECGDNCDYRASQITEVHVTVGEGSQVECESLSECDVECLGSCTVEIHQVGTWSVECSDGLKTGGGTNDETVTCD